MLVYTDGMKSIREPLQDRSRATVERLLNATISLLDQEGLDGALIPRIAEAAGMAPANVYRRFVDKNALLRAAFLHALMRSEQHNRETMAAQVLGESLTASAERLMDLLLAQYQRHPRFLRALSRFIDGDCDAGFIAAARSSIAANVDLLVDILLAHRHEIRHELPERALRFAILSATCSIETYALDPSSIWHVEPSVTAEELIAHLGQGFAGYLVAPGPRR